MDRAVNCINFNDAAARRRLDPTASGFDVNVTSACLDIRASRRVLDRYGTASVGDVDRIAGRFTRAPRDIPQLDVAAPRSAIEVSLYVLDQDAATSGTYPPVQLRVCHCDVSAASGQIELALGFRYVH